MEYVLINRYTSVLFVMYLNRDGSGTLYHNSVKINFDNEFYMKNIVADERLEYLGLL